MNPSAHAHGSAAEGAACDDDANATVPCIVCGQRRGSLFFTLPRLPVHVGQRYDDQAAARNAPMGRVELIYCQHCSHVFNRAFEPHKIDYRPGYEIALYHSPVFQRFMEAVADRLIERFRLREKTILEIGAGRGWFLELLCQRGNNRGVGVDPTVPDEVLGKLADGSVEMIRELFDARFAPRFARIEPDLVCCLSVFEHVPRPYQLLVELRQMIGARPTAVYFEIFNAFRAFERRETWSILYEQCSYFSPRSFALAFERSGYRVLECSSCYEDGQYLYVDALADNAPATPPTGRDSAASCLPMPTEIRQFADNFQTRLNAWHGRLQEFAQRNLRVVFWGSGGKGVSFLNLLPTQGLVDYVAEINPDKQGGFIPGSGQPIVAPEFLPAYRPDVIILSNALYEPEIRQQATALGLECEFYVA